MLKTMTVRTTMAAILAGLSMSAYAIADPARRIDVPAGELVTALESLAQQADIELVYQAEQLRGIHTGGISGTYEPKEAVSLLLEGTQLTIRTDEATGVMLIAPPAPKAPSIAPSPSSGEGRGEVRKKVELEEIVVTGTHLRGIAPESSPVLVFTREDIEASGRTSVEQFMQAVPQNFQGGVNQENFNVSNSGMLITQHGAGINLRGLGQRATLVLVDGKRVAPSGNGSFVDVSLIPLSAVQRMEVLTDGASAIYGSDAVGGVVNFILRRDLQGFESELLVGSATTGDGDQLRLAQSAGTSWEGGNAFLAYDYRKQDRVLAGDRKYTVNVPPTSFFLPEEQRHSVLASAKHSLTERIDTSVLAMYSERRNRRDFFVSSSPLILDADAEAQEYSIAADVNVALTASWNAQISAAHSRANTAQLTLFTDGRGLFNDVETRNDHTELGIKLDGALFDLPGGAVRIALGGQVRRRSHDTDSTTDLSGEQTVQSLFAEVLLPWVSPANAVRGVERLELNAAVRLEDYDAHGSTVDPKIGLLWAPFRDVKLRATYGTSFRAPLLAESTGIYNAFYYAAQSPFLYINPSEGTGTPLLLLGFDPDMTTEQSETWTVGLEYQPSFAKGITLSANYFDTEFDDRITQPSSSLRVIGNPAFEPLIIRNPSLELVQSYLAGADEVIDSSGPGSSPGNATPSDVSIISDMRTSNTALTHTDGIDISLRYDTQLGAHHVGLNGSATYLLSFDDQLTPAAPSIEAMNNALRPVDLRARAGINWHWNAWTANVLLNHTDGYQDLRYTPARPVGAYRTVDATVAYRFDEGAGFALAGAQLSINALNVLDGDPPFLSPAPGTVRGHGYDPVNASGLGRFISLQLRKNW